LIIEFGRLPLELDRMNDTLGWGDVFNVWHWKNKKENSSDNG